MKKKYLPSSNVKHTTKKVKYAGTKRYIDEETGEYIECQVQRIEERDFNFTKVWMRQFIQTLDMLGNQKTRVALWIIDNINKENQLVATQRSISEESGVSLKTVADTMKILMDSDFLRKNSTGAGYIINADILFKGSRTSRLNVLNQFEDAKNHYSKKVSDVEKIENFKKIIHDYEMKIAKLQGLEPIDVEVEEQYSFDENMNVIQKSEESKE